MKEEHSAGIRQQNTGKVDQKATPASQSKIARNENRSRRRERGVDGTQANRSDVFCMANEK